MNNVLDTYGESFQFFIIKAILNSPQFFKAIREHLEPEYITNEYAQIFYKLICEFYNSNKKIPEYDTLEYLVKGKYHNNSLVKGICLKYIYKLENLRVFKDEEEIKQKTIDFCKRCAAIKTTEKTVSLLETYNSNIDLEPDFQEIYKMWGDVLKISSDKIDSEMVECLEEVYSNENIRKNVKPTGYKILDCFYAGGLGSGDLHTTAAFSGIGKTNMMINFGTKAIKNNQSVLHFTFENSKNYLMRRYHSILTNIPLKNLWEKRKTVIELMENQYNKKLHIKENPMVKYKLSHLENYYEQLLDIDFKPDKIIIDSPLHLKSSNGREKRNEELSDIWKEVKSWAQIIETPIYVTAQLNRSAAGERNAESNSIGDSIDIFRDSDCMLYLGKTDSDGFNGKLFATNKKDRYGTDGQNFEFLWNPLTCELEEEEISCSKIISQIIQQEMNGNI